MVIVIVFWFNKFIKSLIVWNKFFSFSYIDLVLLIILVGFGLVSIGVYGLVFSLMR